MTDSILCRPLLLCPLVLVFAAAQLQAKTTIYVGKHFEVRDHDQPTKYVFNGSTRVAHITGSLSTNTRIQRFRLHVGWNLLSLAVSATNLSDQLQRPSVVASAHSWNAQTGSYAPVPQVASSGMVLWVNATTNTILAVVGTYADPINRHIAAGTTYLATTGLEAWSPNFPLTLAAWSFDPQPSTLNSQPTWLARLTGDLSSINELPRTFAPGHALYVIANAPYELEVSEPALRIRYYHQDHLGSSSVMTDADGALVEETAFYPFGIPRHEHRLRQVEEAYKFTQKERDNESGLHYFEARYLAGEVSKFLSVDPKYASTDSSAGDPQALNLYAYVRNNPLQYTDPMGLDRDPPWVGVKASATASVNGDGGADKAEKSCGASFSAGFGDNILPKWTLWGPAAFLTGLLGPSIGPSFEFGPAARGWLGINNVDEDSGCYTAGGVFQAVTSLGVGPGAVGAAKGGFNLLSPILQYGGRDIVIVSDAAGRVQPMYRSTGWAGKTHGVKPGEWGPFDDIMGGQLMKSAYYGESGLAKTDPLYGFGTSGNKAMSQWLGAQSLPAGTDVGDAFSIINDAITKLKQK